MCRGKQAYEQGDIAYFLTKSEVVYNLVDGLWNFNLFFTTTMLYILYAEQMDLLYPLGPSEYLGKIYWRLMVFPFLLFAVNWFPDMKSINWTGFLGYFFTILMLVPVMVAAVMIMLGDMGRHTNWIQAVDKTFPKDCH